MQTVRLERSHRQGVHTGNQSVGAMRNMLLLSIHRKLVENNDREQNLAAFKAHTIIGHQR